MRTIKFRAWDIRNKIMIENAIELIKIRDLIRCRLDLENPFNYFDGLEWLQFTGLKDKNGKEIYESDNVGNIHFKGEVVIENGNTKIKVIESSEKTVWYYLDLHNSQVEIIGNIYENPELLK